jgi:hypothetical protein
MSASGVFLCMNVHPLHTVVETPEFRRRVRSLLSEKELGALVDHVAAAPDDGDLMVGTGGARKLRWAAKGRGKCGGVRVITYFGGSEVPVFLLTMFGKGERVNLSKAERNDLRKMLHLFTEEYRKGVK